MKTILLHDKKNIEPILRRDVDLHIYGIGDLDDFFYPYTTWHAIKDDTNILDIALIYESQSLPILLALTKNPDIMKALLVSMLDVLPPRFIANLSPGLAAVFEKEYCLTFKGEYLRMSLCQHSRVYTYPCPETVRLGSNDLDELMDFYQQCYPENWFDPKILETEKFFGIRKNGQIISAAGVHVYSKQYKAAALGNIATAPSHRNKGYGRQVTARVCRSLLRDDCHIGLNVKADNIPGISCYKKLGFEVAASYDEYIISSG